MIVGASVVISTTPAAGIVTVTHMIVVQSGVAASTATGAMIVIVMVLVSMAMASMFFAATT